MNWETKTDSLLSPLVKALRRLKDSDRMDGRTRKGEKAVCTFRRRRRARKPLRTNERTVKAAPSLSMFGGVGDRFGDYLWFDCDNLPWFDGHNRFKSRKFTRPLTKFSKSIYIQFHFSAANPRHSSNMKGIRRATLNTIPFSVHFLCLSKVG